MGDGDRELLIALDGDLAGKSERQIAEDLFGRERVVAEWGSDSWMRSRVRRRLAKGRKLAASGYRDIAAGRPVKC